jgi:hypothetical protein
MNWQPIKKQHASSLQPNLDNYERVCAEFSWEKIRGELNGEGTGRTLYLIRDGSRNQHCGCMI